MSSVKDKNFVKGASITGRAQITCVKVIHSRLSRDNLLEFRKMCFGKFLDLSQLQYQGQLMYLILSSMDNNCLGKGRLSFHISNRPMEFGPSEYFYISGLDFSSVRQPPSSSQMYNEIFDGKRNMKFADIENAFKYYAELHKGDGLLVLKLSMLYFLYGLLLNRDFGHKNIDMRYFHIIDDIALFNRFPWGRISYDFLVDSCYSAFKSLNRQKKKSKIDRVKVDTHGFSISLQLWALEVMPSLAAYCAIQPVEMESSVPRMLRWSVKSYYKFDQLKDFFTSTCDDSVRPIAPSDDEMVLLQQSGISQYECEPMVHCPIVTKSIPSKAQTKRRMSTEEERYDALEFGHGQLATQPNAVDDIHVMAKRSAHRMGVMENALVDLTHKVDCILAFVYANQQAIQTKTAESVAQSAPTADAMKGSGLMQSTGIVSKIKVHQCTNKVAVLNEEDKLANDDLVLVISDDNSPHPVACFNGQSAHVKCQQSASVEIIWPTVSLELNVDQSARSIRLPKKRKMARKLNFDYSKNPELTYLAEVYDPIHPYAQVNIKVFENWYNIAINSKKPMVVHLPIQIVTTATGEWFSSIWESLGQLDNEHCDALLNLIILISTKASHLFSSDWAVVESMGTQTLMAPFIHKVNERILSYVNGTYPRQGGKSWNVANKLYGIAHVYPNHWVLYEISITDQTITVYDSMSQTTNWQRIEAAFYNIRRNMHWLCEHAGVWKHRGFPTKTKTVWDLLRCSHPPQQTNGSDCGIMAVKFFECLVTGKDLAVINPYRCGEFRQVYCAYLHQLGAEG